jgi:hypothetical protein
VCDRCCRSGQKSTERIEKAPLSMMQHVIGDISNLQFLDEIQNTICIIHDCPRWLIVLAISSITTEIFRLRMVYCTQQELG